MTSIATLSGRVIDYLDPDPEQMILDDIAAGLAAQPRYTGQTTRRYSVAMHSLLVASLVEPKHRLHALLHDAAEGFLADVPSPAKEAMRILSTPPGRRSSYDELEDRLWRAICRRYDISPDIPEDVHRADHLAMVVEAPILQPDGWRHSVWDFARDDEKAVAGAHRETLLRLLALPGGGKIDWMWHVVDLLAGRRA